MQIHKAFVCYSSRDRQGPAKVVIEILQRLKVEYWLDTEKLSARIRKNKKLLQQEIAKGLQGSTVVLVLLTRNFQQFGPWAWREYAAMIVQQIALGQQIVVPCVFEDTNIRERFPPGLEADFRPGREQGDAQLSEILENLPFATAQSPAVSAGVEKLDFDQIAVQQSVMLCNLATMLGRQSNFPAARSLLRSVPVHFPQAVLEAGQVFSAQGDFVGAIELYKIAAEMWQKKGRPPDPKLAMNWGTAVSAMGMHEEAITHFKEAHRQFKSQKTPLPPHLPHNLGVNAVAQGETGKAERYYGLAQRLREKAGMPDDPDWLAGMGDIYARTGALDKAVKWFQRAIKTRNVQGLAPEPLIYFSLTQIEICTMRKIKLAMRLPSAGNKGGRSLRITMP